MQDAHTSFPGKKINPKSSLFLFMCEGCHKEGCACYSEIIPQILFSFWWCASSWCPLQRLCGLVWPQPKPHFHPFRRAGCAQLSFKSRLVLRKGSETRAREETCSGTGGFHVVPPSAPKLSLEGSKAAANPSEGSPTAVILFLGGLWYSSKCLTAGEVEVGNGSSCEAMMTLWMLVFSFFAVDYWLF